MRKFLFFIILIPFFATLGHDIYIFTQDQSKGFRLSDIGALWSKYHKESHDQWKIKLSEVNSIAADLTPDITIHNNMTQETQSPSNIKQPTYAESFTQTSEEHKKDVVTQLKKSSAMEKTSEAHKVIGFILEQTAIFVFGGFAAFIFIMSLIFGFIFGGRSSNSDSSSAGRKVNKKQYSRK